MLHIKKILAWVTLVSVSAMASCGIFTQGEDPNHVHDLIKYASRTATYRKDGRLTYWHCPDCNKYYLDADATQKVSRHTCLRNTDFLAKLNLSPFSAPDIDIRVDSPAFWKGILTLPSTLRRRPVSH